MSYLLTIDGQHFYPDARELGGDFWVEPNGERRTKARYPYSYDEFYLFGDGQTRKCAEDAVYTDRLWQWDHEKYDRCCKLVSGRWDQASEASASKWLSAYFGKPVKVMALAEGCNQSNGYPYWILWFRKESLAPAPDASLSRDGR